MAMQQTYNDLVPKLQETLGVKNVLAVPRLEKIVLNIALKEGITDKKIIEEAISQLGTITGQRPVATKAKKAIANFKLRQGDLIGVMVTLRGKRMYDFFEKLIHIVFPRVRDFRGIKKTSFDGKGGYSFGFSEMSVFSEIDTSVASRLKGVQVTIKTTGKDTKETMTLLEQLGMPFQKERVSA